MSSAATSHSFVVLAYGASSYIDECLASLAAQSVRVPIVVSTSTPYAGLEQLCERHGASLQVHGPNGGIGHDWNVAYTSATTDWVTLAHQDDVYDPTYAAFVSERASLHPYDRMVFSTYYEIVNGARRPTAHMLRIKRLLLELGFLGAPRVTSRTRKRRVLRLGNPVPCPAVALNKRMLPDFRFRDDMKTNMDWVAWLDIAEEPGGIGLSRRPLVGHRIHPGSETERDDPAGRQIPGRPGDLQEPVAPTRRSPAGVCLQPVVPQQRGFATMTEIEYGPEYTTYQADRAAWRRVVRRPWLRAAARFTSGPVVDLGCGVGELLERLAPDSIGLEINRASIAHCRAKGLDVGYYDGSQDDWRLGPVNDRSTTFDTLVLSHVLEHLEDPTTVLHKILAAAGPLGFRQVLVLVPGRAGFRHDDTHRTFVDRAMLADAMLTADTDFALSHTSYFPGNLRRIGDWFTYHELRAAFIRRAGAAKRPSTS